MNYICYCKKNIVYYVGIIFLAQLQIDLNTEARIVVLVGAVKHGKHMSHVPTVQAYK